ncbi:hypothetical protein [Paraburkholderia sp. C35]|uniref:hypothetical protein n=1 Tax=Paraburkholderia sp. C35 TaxID=2126993 RepID=UPI0013A56D34|nr:hypothetical protein [Paraburkholderia sp. C35]
MSGTIELTPVDPEQFDRFIDAIVRMEPPQMPQKTLDGLLGRLDYLRQPVEFKAECEPPYERRSEAGQLRRENIWREKQARALFNARVNQERRKRKQMRGIGRR